MSFRFRLALVKDGARQLKSAKDNYKRIKRFIKKAAQLAVLLPDELIPGYMEINTVFDKEIKFKVPYDMSWFVGYKAELLRLGWEVYTDWETEWYEKPHQTKRLFKFRYPLSKYSWHEIQIEMNARAEGSVCQLIELEEVEVIEKKMTYEIICPEGENALEGEIR